MKILQITRQFYPSIGGIENVTYGLSQSLQRLGHHCDVATLRYIYNSGQTMARAEQIEGLQVYRLSHTGSRRYTIAPGVLAFVPNYDILHIHAIDFFIDFLSLARPIHRKPLVVNTHGGIFHTNFLLPLKHFIFRTVTRLSLQAAAAVICDSQHDYDLFKTILPAHKLSIIRNGVSLSPFLKIKKNITHGLLLGIGRIVENKRIEYLLELLPQLITEFPDLHLVWIGHDPEQRIPHLMNYAQQLGVASKVQFVGQISEAQVCELLTQANLFVSTASYEAFGLSTIEAMGSGTIPVVTPVGIHSEVIKNNQTGFIFQAENKSQVLTCFRDALSLNPSQQIQIGQNARQAALEFSWDTVVHSYLKLYQSVLYD